MDREGRRFKSGRPDQPASRDCGLRIPDSSYSPQLGRASRWIGKVAGSNPAAPTSPLRGIADCKFRIPNSGLGRSPMFHRCIWRRRLGCISETCGNLPHAEVGYAAIWLKQTPILHYTRCFLDNRCFANPPTLSSSPEASMLRLPGSGAISMGMIPPVFPPPNGDGAP